jgi:hypothetical protein
MYIKSYKGYSIEKTMSGYYRAYMTNESRFVMADTLKEIKRLIDKDRKRM